MTRHWCFTGTSLHDKRLHNIESALGAQWNTYCATTFINTAWKQAAVFVSYLAPSLNSSTIKQNHTAWTVHKSSSCCAVDVAIYIRSAPQHVVHRASEDLCNCQDVLVPFIKAAATHKANFLNTQDVGLGYKWNGQQRQLYHTLPYLGLDLNIKFPLPSFSNNATHSSKTVIEELLRLFLVCVLAARCRWWRDSTAHVLDGFLVGNHSL